jgi:hypothetical protein
MITYRAMPGDNISHACREAVALADKHGDTAEFDFNDVHVVVYPGENPAAVVVRWDAEFERKAEAYRTSPEGKAAAAYQEARARQCQRQTDDLIARLSTVVHDLPALVRWCAALSECGDHRGITWDKGAVAVAIEAAGYQADAHVGRPPAEFGSKRLVGEYIIGQVLDCLRRGMSPHPVTRKFAEDYAAMPDEETQRR